jgi:hypothetical protein
MKTSPILAAASILMSFLSFSGSTEAKIIYTALSVTVSGNGSINLDLNHDGRTDFVILSASQIAYCGLRGGLYGSTVLTPALGDVSSCLICALQLCCRAGR